MVNSDLSLPVHVFSGLNFVDEICSITCASDHPDRELCLQRCQEGMATPDVQARLAQMIGNQPSPILNADDGIFPSLFQEGIEDVIMRVFHSIQPHFEFFIVNSFLILSSRYAVNKFLKASEASNSSAFIKNIALANLATIPTIFFLSGSMETSIITAAGLSCTSGIVHLCKRKPATLNLDQDLSHTSEVSRRKRKHSKEKGVGKESIVVNEANLDELRAEIDDLNPMQDREIDAIIEAAGLNHEIVKSSLEALKKKTLFNPNFSQPFSVFKEKVREITLAKCTYCHKGNQFTGTAFVKTLFQCRACPAGTLTHRGICQQQHWHSSHK